MLTLPLSMAYGFAEAKVGTDSRIGKAITQRSERSHNLPRATASSGKWSTVRSNLHPVKIKAKCSATAQKGSCRADIAQEFCHQPSHYAHHASQDECEAKYQAGSG